MYETIKGRKVTWNRSEKLNGFTIKVKTGLGNTYITINEQDNKPIEIFATVGKSGKSITAKTEAIGRLISLNLQNGCPVEKIIEQLKGIAGENSLPGDENRYLSIPDAIGKVLEDHYAKKEKQ